MNKRILIGGILAAIIIGGIGYSILKLNKDKKINDIKVEQKKGGKTVIKNNSNTGISGLTDQELIKKYLLLKDSKIPVRDRAEASEVARKFAKAITEYNSDNPTEGEQEALSCVSDDIYKDVQGMFITKGKEKSSDLNKVIVTKEDSEEYSNDEDNDYIYIRVREGINKIDNHNQIHKDSATYVVQLLKINGEYKVTSFRVR